MDVGIGSWDRQTDKMAYQPVSNGAGGGPEGDDMPNDELGQIHLKMNQTTDEVSGVATCKLLMVITIQNEISFWNFSCVNDKSADIILGFYKYFNDTVGINEFEKSKLAHT